MISSVSSSGRRAGSIYFILKDPILKDVFDVEGVDTSRTRTNNISEISQVLGIEAARNAIIHEAVSTLNEQGILVDVRHIMLVADMMCMEGEVKQIGRHGIAGEKESVLSRAAFEVTVNHLLDAAVANEVDELIRRHRKCDRRPADPAGDRRCKTDRSRNTIMKLKNRELHMDFNASLRRAIKTGDVLLGQNNTEKCIE